MQAGIKVSRAGTDLDVTKHPYAEAVGALMYLAVCTRPDISQAVSTMARYMSKPTQEHWSLLKGILQYLKGTQELALTYGPEGELKVYSDSDFAGDPDTRRSTAGLVTMNRRGDINWSSKVMHTVALSTTEAEYMALCAAVKEALWLRKCTDPFWTAKRHDQGLRRQSGSTETG